MSGSLSRRPVALGEMGKPLAVLDGDDTLWWTEPLYDDARRAAGRVVARAGIDPDRWERLERTLDVENVALLGFSPSRFPTSCVEAYRALASPPSLAVEKAVLRAASAVFRAPAARAPSARPVLDALVRSYRLVLLTKGDDAVQRRRVEASGLADLLDVVEIVVEKGRGHFASLVQRFGASPSASWSIGNSWRSDIEPALASGLHAVWIDAHVWEYERHGPAVADHPRLVVARSLDEVPAAIEAALVG